MPNLKPFSEYNSEVI